MGLILALRQCKIPPKNTPKIYLKRVSRELMLGVWGPRFGAILGVWAGSGSQGRLGRHLGRLQGGFRPQHGPNLGPKMAPSWSQNRTKNDAKIYHFLDAFKNAILKDFGSIFGGKMEPSWGQDRVKHRSYLEMCEKRQNTVKPMKFQ